LALLVDFSWKPPDEGGRVSTRALQEAPSIISLAGIILVLLHPTKNGMVKSRLQKGTKKPHDFRVRKPLVGNLVPLSCSTAWGLSRGFV